MTGDVTRFLAEWNAGDPEAVARLVPLGEVLAIDMALERLAELDERAKRVVECRIFGGLTLEETARALDLSTGSVQRSWTSARAWLRKEIGMARIDAD